MYRKLDEAALGTILEAGIAEFARCGFQPASVASVAKNAGVSVGVIYKYFGDKDAFFLACVRHSLELLDATLQEAAAGGGPLEGGQLTERIEPQLFAFFFDNLLMMLQFSYSCEYYQERMRIFCGEAALEDTKMADRLTRFLLGAMKGDVCSISSLTTSERPESRPACSEPNRISG